MATPRLLLLVLIALSLRAAVIGADAPAPTSVSYEEFKRAQESHCFTPKLLTGIEAIAALHGDDWERRWDAAEALGLAGNHTAIDELISALINDEDWRLTFVAAIALGRLGDSRAVPALTAVSESHWYPQVRSAARKALAVIARKATYPEDRKPVADLFFIGPLTPDYLDQSYLQNLSVAYTEKAVLALRSCPDELNRAELEFAAARIQGVSLPEKPFKRPPFHPRCGLRLDRGTLLGSNYGEWGGELVLVESPTAVHLLIDDNIVGLHRIPCGIVAVAGCGHMGNRIAHLYLVTQSGDGAWSARKWRSLPAAPHRSGFLPDGRLYIECDNREDVILSLDGKLSLAE